MTPFLALQPSVNTTTVTTTTTTTTTYAPIQLPPLPAPSAPRDPKYYPLLHASFPKSLRNFPLVFPNGSRATFHDADAPDQSTDDDDIRSGAGWHMLKKEHQHPPTTVNLPEAVERYAKKRSHDSPDPPRKKVRAAPAPTTTGAAPPSPLPSPNGSPEPPIWPSPTSSAPLQPDLALTTLLTLPSLLNHFSALPPALQSHFLLTLLRHSPLPVLRTLHSVLTPTLARDFLTLLPPELVSHILFYLPFQTLARATRVSKAWRTTITSDPVLWKDHLASHKLWFGRDSESTFANAIYSRRILSKSSIPRPTLSLPHPYRTLFKSRMLTRTKWVTNPSPKHLSFPAHGSAVVTCLVFSHNRIISASDDHSIHVYSPLTGDLLLSLKGHEGGVWALAACKDTLVSGSTDRTVRIWDLKSGRCTHVFGGHTSTVRCLAIVKPEIVDVERENGIIVKEKWPKRSLIVTGSRDHSLRVWTLPRPTDPEYTCFSSEESQIDIGQVCDASENPYHRTLLDGHDHAVRALAARGRTLVSGSYDCTVRIWDLITGKSKFVLVGHTQKVYSVVLDMSRNQACSGSMDGTVRVWSVLTGECVFVLMGHTSLVGLLGLSPSYLVSAAADSTLRIWNLDTGDLVHTLAAHTGAITCFVHDEFKVLSGSDGNLKMWDVREGGVVRDLLGGVQGVWQVVCEGRWCVAASNRGDRTVLDVWDFGRVEGGGGDAPEGEGEGEDGWVGEVVGGVYDDDVFGEGGVDDDEDEEDEELDFVGETKGKSKVDDDDAMDLDGEEVDGDEEMSSPVHSRGGSVSASGSRESSRKPGMFRFYGHRHRRQAATAPSGSELEPEQQQRDAGVGETEEGEGEMQDMRVVEGLVAAAGGGAGGVSFEFGVGAGGGWDERLGANVNVNVKLNTRSGAGTGASRSRLLNTSTVGTSSHALLSTTTSASQGGSEAAGPIRSLPPTSGQDETPTRPGPNSNRSAGGRAVAFGVRRK